MNELPKDYAEYERAQRLLEHYESMAKHHGFDDGPFDGHEVVVQTYGWGQVGSGEYFTTPDNADDHTGNENYDMFKKTLLNSSIVHWFNDVNSLVPNEQDRVCPECDLVVNPKCLRESIWNDVLYRRQFASVIAFSDDSPTHKLYVIPVDLLHAVEFHSYMPDEVFFNDIVLAGNMYKFWSGLFKHITNLANLLKDQGYEDAIR